MDHTIKSISSSEPQSQGNIDSLTEEDRSKIANAISGFDTINLNQEISIFLNKEYGLLCSLPLVKFFFEQLVDSNCIKSGSIVRIGNQAFQIASYVPGTPLAVFRSNIQDNVRQNNSTEITFNDLYTAIVNAVWHNTRLEFHNSALVKSPK